MLSRAVHLYTAWTHGRVRISHLLCERTRADIARHQIIYISFFCQLFWSITSQSDIQPGSEQGRGRGGVRGYCLVTDWRRGGGGEGVLTASTAVGVNTRGYMSPGPALVALRLWAGRGEGQQVHLPATEGRGGRGNKTRRKRIYKPTLAK